MCAQWKNTFNPTYFIKLIEDSKKVDKNGRISFQGFGFSEYSLLLRSGVNFKESIPESEQYRVVRQSLFNCAKNKMESQQLISEISRFENEYYRKETKKYYFVTAFSADLMRIDDFRKSFDGNSISFYRHLPDKIEKQRKKIMERARDSAHSLETNKFGFAKILVSGKSHQEAVENGFDTIKFVLGIWNFFYLRTINWSLSFGGKVKPVNKFILGPVQTLHTQNLELATETFWYNPHYVGSIQAVPLFKNFEKIRKFEKSFEKFYKNHKYKKFIRYLFIRYYDALDEFDLKSSFLKLWSVLEALTVTKDAKYATTIKRAVFCCKDPDFHREYLNVLKDFRNEATHLNASTEEIESYVFILKRYVENLLQFHLVNKLNFSSQNETANFMDIQNDISGLKDKIALMKKAIMYLSD